MLYPPNSLIVLYMSGCCLIKFIGRNCRIVVVDGVFLKAEQEVMAGPGTKIILNLNNKVRFLLAFISGGTRFGDVHRPSIPSFASFLIRPHL